MPSSSYPGCRRKSDRAPCRLPAELTLPSGSKVSGRVEELSEGGVLFTSPSEVDLGVHAELRFPEPIGGRIVLVRVTCRWHAPREERRVANGFEFWASPSPPVELFRAYVTVTRRN